MVLSFGNTVLHVSVTSDPTPTYLEERVTKTYERLRRRLFFSGLCASWMNFRVFERPAGRTALVTLDWVEFLQLELVYVNDYFDVNR